jgi:eukaryotic-like serine/threonine-protein kinase
MTEEEILVAAHNIDAPLARREYIRRACHGDLQLQHRLHQRLNVPNLAGVHRDSESTTSDADTETVGLKTVPLPDLSELSSRLAAESAADAVPKKATTPPVSAGMLLAQRYRIKTPIGHGGMGWVLLARDELRNQNVAVKLLNSALVATPEAAETLRHEAQAAASVTHANLVAIETVEESDGVPFLVMEFVDGESLARRLERKKSLKIGEVLRIGCEIADGLSAAHRNGLIHLDIKPANILLEKFTGQVRISDFGLARVTGDQPLLTSEWQTVGTPQYMPPEQASGMPVDARSDLFSLGVVLYEMCTGVSPFRAETGMATLRRVRDEQPPGLSKVCPELPAELASVIARLMAKRPADRIQTAAELATTLRRLAVVYDHTRFPRIACSPIAI